MYRIFDLFDKDPPRDWSSELKKLYGGIEEKREATQAKADFTLVATRIANTSLNLSLKAYAGTYTDPYFGTVQIAMEGDELRYEVNRDNGTLEHWHFNAFRMHSDRPQNESHPLLTFNPDPSGKPAKIILFGDWELERTE